MSMVSSQLTGGDQWQTTVNHGEFTLAHAMERAVSQAIVKRLKEERMGFDNQLAGIERTLKVSSNRPGRCRWLMVLNDH